VTHVTNLTVMHDTPRLVIAVTDGHVIRAQTAHTNANRNTSKSGEEVNQMPEKKVTPREPAAKASAKAKTPATRVSKLKSQMKSQLKSQMKSQMKSQ
jgi:ferric-dicitrate binding protein FerR (iron transport regulator)